MVQLHWFEQLLGLSVAWGGFIKRAMGDDGMTDREGERRRDGKRERRRSHTELKAAFFVLEVVNGSLLLRTY